MRLASPVDRQIRLSEKLQLLREFRYTDIQRLYRSTWLHNLDSYLRKDEDTEVHILHTLDVVLSTGQSGDDYAIALDE